MTTKSLTTADQKRLAVLRNAHNVYDTADAIRLYMSIGDSRSVRAEATWLLRRHLIEPVEREGGHCYRITNAGRDQIDEWEKAA